MSLDIMHIDMDAFFASVEQLDNPDISGKQVIVGGLGKRGVVSTASYEARKYGVHSAMPMTEARKLCPEGIFISGRHKRYAELSGDIYQIFKNYTPLVEKVSIDEAFLDLKGCHRLFGNSVEIGKKIKKEIKNKTGLTASAGLAPNKFLAKLASDMDKPDGFFVIEEDRIAEILEPLSVNKMWGVGKKATKVLKNKGISTVGQLKKLSLNELSAIFGKMGIQLYYLSRGIDNRSVSQDDEIKSISHEETYSQDLKDREEIYQKLLSMAERVSRRMRKKGYKGNTIFIKIRYGDFTTLTRRTTLPKAINDTDSIYHTARELLKKDKLLRKPVRLLGIGVSSLKENQGTQLSLFSDNIGRDKLTRTIDHIKDRFGDRSITRAANLNNKGREK